MKIVSGKYGGRRLNVPKNRDIRPTTDKVRGAVFNMLHSRAAVEDARVLDAYCGSGALGLEALSRGAVHCSFVDKARASLDLARGNAGDLGAMNESDFHIIDWSKKSVKSNVNDTYSLIFLDPPYKKDLIAVTLEKLIQGNWLSAEAWIVCESEKNLGFPVTAGMQIDHQKVYGDIQITLIRVLADYPAIQQSEQPAP